MDKKVLGVIIVAALGYFVDAYDLIVATVVRSTAIVDLGLAIQGSPEVKSIGQIFEYTQSFGILLGGIVFGIYGDKIGRKKALYASIFIFSLTTLLNGFLYSSTPFVFEIYCVLRFISGFALAAELGLGIVLISESMKANTRGYGSMFVVSFGIFGCILAAYLFEFHKVDWRTLYIVGGIAGFSLMALRYYVNESLAFQNQTSTSENRGNLLHIFNDSNLRSKFIYLILLGFPIYYFVSIPIKFAADFGKEYGLTIKGTLPIIIFYIALSLSDIVSNYVSQKLKSRKKTIQFYLILCAIAVLVLNFHKPSSTEEFLYIICPIMGFASGYWALLITYIAEQVGTNIRATFTTSIPNIIRSLFIPIQLSLTVLQVAFGTKSSIFFIGVCSIILSFYGLSKLKDTFGNDLNFENEYE